MNMQEIQDRLKKASTIRGVKHEAGRIYKENGWQPGSAWNQQSLQIAVVEQKTTILGHRPKRRGRSGKGNVTDGKDMSW